MAPELFRGEPPTACADVYSAAIVAYELLVGITPFAGDTPARGAGSASSTEDVELPADARALISPELERVLLRALDKDPPRRFPDAAASRPRSRRRSPPHLDGALNAPLIPRSRDARR